MNLLKFKYLILILCVAAVALFFVKKNKSSAEVDYSSISIDSDEDHALPSSLLMNTNPKVDTQRSLTSDEDKAKEDKTDAELTDNEKNPDTYSLEDPNLYEDTSPPVDDLDILGQIGE